MIAARLLERLTQLHDRVWESCSRMLPTGRHVMSRSTKRWGCTAIRWRKSVHWWGYATRRSAWSPDAFTRGTNPQN